MKRITFVTWDGAGKPAALPQLGLDNRTQLAVWVGNRWEPVVEEAVEMSFNHFSQEDPR
jgi:hypothetical protein